MERATAEDLASIAAALAPAIGLPKRGSDIFLDERLARLGNRRHRIGALLNLALTDCGVLGNEPATTLLSRIARKTIEQQLRLAASQERMASALTGAGIAFLTIKGSALSDELYLRPALRRVRDIDVLVDPADADDALQTLERAGYELVKQANFGGDTPIARGSWRQRSEMRVFKDQLLRDTVHGVQLELHCRLFKVGPQAITAGVKAEAGEAQQASLSSDHYALYIILHGALDYWPRLKWLADLSLLMRKLDHARCRRILSLADRHDCRDAVIASLLFCEEILPGSLDTERWGLPSDIDIAPQGNRQTRLLQRFHAALGGHYRGEWHRPPPIPTGDNPARLVFGRSAPLATVLAQRLLKSILLRV